MRASTTTQLPGVAMTGLRSSSRISGTPMAQTESPESRAGDRLGAEIDGHQRAGIDLTRCRDLAQDCMHVLHVDRRRQIDRVRRRRRPH